MSHQSESAELLTICTRAARAAASHIAASANRIDSIDWTAKSPTDFVSEVDIAAEGLILDVFRAELPEASFLAEESGAEKPLETLAKGLTVVVDPLDGTTNFLHGYPEYAVSIAVLSDSVPVAGVVFDVPGNELFTATRGGGTRLNGVVCRCSATTNPQRALVGTGFPFKDPADIPHYQQQMAKVMAAVSGIRRPGAASIDLASVASGRFDVFWEEWLAPWDYAAGLLLVQEAGGLVTGLSGQELNILTPGGVLAGGSAMHSWLLETLSK